MPESARVIVRNDNFEINKAESGITVIQQFFQAIRESGRT